MPCNSACVHTVAYSYNLDLQAKLLCRNMLYGSLASSGAAAHYEECLQTIRGCSLLSEHLITHIPFSETGKTARSCPNLLFHIVILKRLASIKRNSEMFFLPLVPKSLHITSTGHWSVRTEEAAPSLSFSITSS